jgi:hypothetical protein
MKRLLLAAAAVALFAIPVSTASADHGCYPIRGYGYSSAYRSPAYYSAHRSHAYHSRQSHYGSHYPTYRRYSAYSRSNPAYRGYSPYYGARSHVGVQGRNFSFHVGF